MENNNKMNEKLINILLGGTDGASDTDKKDDKELKTINLCTCRYEYNDNFEDVDDKEFEAITETYHQMLAARTILFLYMNIS